jgi:zinc transporter 1
MSSFKGQGYNYGGTPEPEPEEEKFNWWHDFDAKAVFIIGNMTMALTLLEFVYAMLTGSLTLIADAFHRLSDVLTMACTFYAIILSHKPQSSKYSYGWKRAEVLGGLCNAIFLLALCFFMTEKIIRSFVEHPKISKPLQVAFVGGAGLIVCILGLFMFDGAGHTHAGGEKCTGHGDGAPTAGHSHGDKPCGGHGAAAAPAAAAGGHSHGDKPCGGHGAPPAKKAGHGHGAPKAGHGHGAKPAAAAGGHSHGDKPCGGHGSGSGNGMLSESMHGVGSGGYSKVDDDDDDEFEAVDATNVNMWQLYLHLVGDVLGALFIIAEGLICYFWEDDHWTVFVDPIFSLIIVGIILATTVPVVQKTVDTLYQTVPDEIDLNKLERKVRNVEGVDGCHELHVWRLVNDVVIGTAHIRTSLSGAESMEMLSRIKAVFHERSVHSLTIQIEYAAEDSVAGRTDKSKSICGLPCVEDCEATKCC